MPHTYSDFSLFSMPMPSIIDGNSMLEDIFQDFWQIKKPILPSNPESP